MGGAERIDAASARSVLGRALVRSAAVLALGALAVNVAACSNGPPSHSIPCPMVRSVPDASYLTRFAGDSEDLTDTDFEAKIDGVSSQCFYDTAKDTKKESIRSELQIQLSASRGPKNKGDKADLKYFVALTGQAGKLLTRQEFDITVPLTADKPTASVVDDPVVKIPLKSGENGDYYRIYVYFDVTQKELAYNRKNPQQQ